MTQRDPALDMARRELVLMASILVLVARLVERADAFLIAGLMPIVVLLAGAAVLRTDEHPGRHFESLLVPAVLTGGAAAAIQLVPAGLMLVPVIAVFAVALDRILALELQLLTQATGVSDSDRMKVMGTAVVAAFVAFSGMAALVPGGLPEPGSATTPTPLTDAWLIVLALDDALIALLLGYRLASLRYGNPRDAARSALTYAIVIAVAAGAIRAMNVPLLIGPAALTLVFYLWDALHASAPARRREPRFLWEVILLAALAVVVVAWNMQIGA